MLAMMQKPTPEKRAEIDDDDDLELPASDADLDVPDREFEPEDDSDLGLGTPNGSEKIGLDAETGLDEAVSAVDLELPDQVDAEGTRWTDGGEAAGELEGEGDESDEGSESEYGWTDGNEPDDDGGFDDGVINLDEGGSFVDDGGAEGLGDEALELEVDPQALPPLEKTSYDGVDPLDEAEGEPEDMERFALDLLDGMGGQLHDEETVELAPGLFCTRVAPQRVQVDMLHEAGQPLIGLTASAQHGVAFTRDGLWVAAAGESAARQHATEASSLWDLAAADTTDGLFIALATPDGLLISNDGGDHLAPGGSLPGGQLPPNRLAITRDGDDVRLWAAAPEGALCASDDGGRTFAAVLGDAQVLRLSSDGRRALLAVARDEDGTAVAEHTIDAGNLFERRELPAGEVERLLDARTCRETVLASRRAPDPRVLVGSSEDPWQELLPLAAPPATLIDEDGGAVAYCCASTEQGEVILRRALDGSVTPQLVLRIPREAGAALQLRGSHLEGVTTLQLGTERQWLRLTLRPGGRLR